ncbi:DUF5994 family protein [Streptomyces alanosinicus]|uniref:Uncharacterized protein n=1 Tax=Streptomyces alanosinicus TaxID=68171 RepID=A0A918YNC0_9ACTN|nr:DUF5994 family protein [Streptomyces alanosinicus]GHE10651.1 hypothetical protein GCM10010339_67570 [Streptomyces alanosinicus]
MAVSDPLPPAGLLTDGGYESPLPGTALLRLTTTHDREGVLDGAWWPRSRHPSAELPGPISAPAERLGPVARVGLDRDARDELPTRMTVDGRVAHIDSFVVGDDTALVTRGDRDHFSLLVTPTDTPLPSARAAMPDAVRIDNPRWAGQILVDTSGGQVCPSGRPHCCSSRRRAAGGSSWQPSGRGLARDHRGAGVAVIPGARPRRPTSVP